MMQLFKARRAIRQTAPGSAGGSCDYSKPAFNLETQNPRRSRGLSARAIFGRTQFVVLCLILSVLAATASAVEKAALVWPQFRGPGGSGIAEDQKPPVEVGP